jgi:hypothetical protein
MSFSETLRKQENLLTEFDERLFRDTVDTIKVLKRKEVTVCFKNGQDVTIDVAHKRK